MQLRHIISMTGQEHAGERSRSREFVRNVGVTCARNKVALTLPRSDIHELQWEQVHQYAWAFDRCGASRSCLEGDKPLIHANER